VHHAYWGRVIRKQSQPGKNKINPKGMKQYVIGKYMMVSGENAMSTSVARTLGVR
jgi:hypothetical protein